MSGWSQNIRFSKLDAAPRSLIGCLSKICGDGFRPTYLQQLDWNPDVLGFDFAECGHPLSLGFQRSEDGGYGEIGESLVFRTRDQFNERAENICEADGFEGLSLCYQWHPGQEKLFARVDLTAGNFRWDLWPEADGSGVELTIFLYARHLVDETGWLDWYHRFLSHAARTLRSDTWVETSNWGVHVYATVDDEAND